MSSIRFVLQNPAHLIAYGFGSGLSPVAPGTVGTLWAWLSYSLFLQNMNGKWGFVFLGLGFLIGWWACTLTAKHLLIADPSGIVWDEIIAFWIILWLCSPQTFWQQCMAFVLFRLFDAVKLGPVKWADQRFKGFGYAGGFGIIFDDLVAAFCTLLVIAGFRYWFS